MTDEVSKTQQAYSVVAAPMESFLSNLMGERESILVRLGQIEDILIKHGKLKRRTKEPHKKS